MKQAPVPGHPNIPISESALRAIRPSMRAVAERIGLPLKRGLRNSSGNVPGTGTGSSIDFQDHRPYVPGDDPRHIDWQAYARSGHYTMKLYREEVRPVADIVLDASPSMFLDEHKTARTLELLYFCLESALRATSSVRLSSCSDGSVSFFQPDEGTDWIPSGTGKVQTAPNLRQVPWRNGSLRILISDLLYADDPQSFLTPLLSSHGRPVIFAPYCAAECDPDWLGNSELEDCESRSKKELRFTEDDMSHYSRTYRNHFDIWRLETQRHGIPLARVVAENPFLAAVSAEGLPSGAVQIL